MVLKILYLLLFIFFSSCNAFEKNNKIQEIQKVNFCKKDYVIKTALSLDGSGILSIQNSELNQVFRFDITGPSTIDAIKFKVLTLNANDMPIILAVSAEPAGSETLFVSKILVNTNQLYKVANGSGWKNVIQGGFHLYGNNLTDAVLWNPIFSEGESHVEPHKFKIQFFHLKNGTYRLVTTKETKMKYHLGKNALAEYGIIKNNDIVKYFPDLNIYR